MSNPMAIAAAQSSADTEFSPRLLSALESLEREQKGPGGRRLGQIDCQKLFSSPFFETYLEQRQVRARETLADCKEIPLVDAIQQTTFENGEENCANYRSQVSQLRALLRLKEKVDATAYTLCSWIYQKPKLLKPMIGMVERYIQEPMEQDEKITPEKFESLMQSTYKATEEAEEFAGKTSIFDNLYDPHFLGNIPYRLFSIEDVRITRMPNPLREAEPGKQVRTVKDLVIIEEFYHYLKTLTQPYLYCNLMSPVKKDGEGKVLVDKVHELDTDPKVGSLVHVVTLDKDSKWYWQSDEYESRNKAGQFKKAFLTQLFMTGDKAAFRWSKKMNLEQWKRSCEEIIDRVHRDFFGEIDLLSKGERRDFIEITYVKLIEKLFKTLNVTNCNITCKHSTDRGPSFMALLYVDYRWSVKGKFLGKDMKRVLALTIQQPLLIQNRPAHEYRINRLTTAGSRILSFHEGAEKRG